MYRTLSDKGTQLGKYDFAENVFIITFISMYFLFLTSL